MPESRDGAQGRQAQIETSVTHKPAKTVLEPKTGVHPNEDNVLAEAPNEATISNKTRVSEWVMEHALPSLTLRFSPAMLRKLIDHNSAKQKLEDARKDYHEAREAQNEVVQAILRQRDVPSDLRTKIASVTSRSHCSEQEYLALQDQLQDRHDWLVSQCTISVDQDNLWDAVAESGTGEDVGQQILEDTAFHQAISQKSRSVAGFTWGQPSSTREGAVTSFSKSSEHISSSVTRIVPPRHQDPDDSDDSFSEREKVPTDTSTKEEMLNYWKIRRRRAQQKIQIKSEKSAGLEVSMSRRIRNQSRDIDLNMQDLKDLLRYHNRSIYWIKDLIEAEKGRRSCLRDGRP